MIMFFIPFIRLPLGVTYCADSEKILYDYSIVLLDEVMKRNDAFVEEEDRERFTSIYVKTFLQSAKSIYTAKRHSNTLAEALPVLKDKVNICDLITITGIKIFYPKLYAVIKDHGLVLAGSLSQPAYDKCSEQILELKATLDAVTNGYNQESDNGNAIREMLTLLFPRLDLRNSDIPQTHENYLYCVERKRICSVEHFEHYFSIPYVTL